MYVVLHQDWNGMHSSCVISLDSIVHFIQLIPKFGGKINLEVTIVMSMDICKDYYMNLFANKEIYQHQENITGFLEISSLF